MFRDVVLTASVRGSTTFFIFTSNSVLPNLSCHFTSSTCICSEASSSNCSRSFLLLIEYNSYVIEKGFLSGVHSIFMFLLSLQVQYLS